MRVKVIKLSCWIWKSICIRFLAILISLGTPLLFSLLLPIFIVRIFVSYLSKIIRPDLGKILNALSSVFASDDFFTNPKWTILMMYSVKGYVDINMLKCKLVEKVIGVRKVGKDLKNIELKQYPYKWMGFIFWKWDDNFDISNHVRYYENKMEKGESSRISTKHLNEIKQQLLLQTYPEKRSPWEIVIVQNIQSNNEEEETAIFFKFHHCVGDGYSLTKLLCFEIMDKAPKEFVHKTTRPEIEVLKKMVNYFKIVKLPFELAECLVEAYAHNDWKIHRSNNYFEVVPDKINLRVIKDVAKKLNTSVNAVIFSAVTAGFKQSMSKQNNKVPNHIHIGLPFPREGHPDKLRNFCSGILMKLPVGENDSMRRLKKIERYLEKFKNSTIPLASLIVSTSVGCMFHWMIRLVAELIMFSPETAIGSVFPGPKGKLTLFGQEIVDIHVSEGPYFGNFGITFSTYSYCNNLNMRFSVNDNILRKETDVEELVSNVVKEFQVLKECANEIV